MTNSFALLDSCYLLEMVMEGASSTTLNMPNDCIEPVKEMLIQLIMMRDEQLSAVMNMR